MIQWNMLEISQNTSGSSSYVFLVYIALIILFVVRRIIRGIRVKIYKRSRILMPPVIYLFLTSIYMFADYKLYGFYYVIFLIFLIVLGVLVGLKFGETAEFFYKDNQLFYKRSQAILSLWLISYIGRLVIFLYLPNVMILAELLDVLLSFTTGLLVGEAIVIIRKEGEFKNKQVESQNN